MTPYVIVPTLSLWESPQTQVFLMLKLYIKSRLGLKKKGF